MHTARDYNAASTDAIQWLVMNLACKRSFSKVRVELATRLAPPLLSAMPNLTGKKPWGTWVTLDSQSDVDVFLCVLRQ